MYMDYSEKKKNRLCFLTELLWLEEPDDCRRDTYIYLFTLSFIVGLGVPARMYMWKPEDNLKESPLSSCHVELTDHIQVIRLSNKDLSPLSHLTRQKSHNLRKFPAFIICTNMAWNMKTLFILPIPSIYRYFCSMFFYKYTINCLQKFWE